MTMMTLQQAHALLPGSTLVGDGGLALARGHSDTRSLQPGDLFVALRGERFDGNDHLPQARQAGAVAALAERGLGDAMPGLLVPDALTALQQLAAAWRARFSLPLIAVTGSNGKTTVTQMVASILREWLGDAALATAGNFNNHIGVPLTLLRLREHHRAAVLELGMNHPGEIALLAGWARPTVALVNNAQREHLEFMVTVEAVAFENGSVIAATAADGAVVIPFDDAHTALWRGLAGGRKVLGFSSQDWADGMSAVQVDAHWDQRAQAWRLMLYTSHGDLETTLYMPGLHNVRNAMAATAAALAIGVPEDRIADGLRNFRPVAGRSQLLTFQKHGKTVTLIDDSYNANPDSMLAAINVLATLPGPRWLLLGDMGEVGDQGPQFHAEAGAQARQQGIDHVWAAGTLMAHAGADRHFGSVAEMLSALSVAQPDAATILVKGSRFMQMEQVVQALQTGATHAA